MKTVDIQKLIDNNESKTTIKAHLIVAGYKTNEIKKILDNIESNVTRLDMPMVVSFIRKNYHENTNRRQLAKLMEANNLCKESTAFHYLSLMNFVEEYVKQELENK